MPDLAGTIQDELDRAAGRLADAGIGEARREALRLWAGLAGSTPGAVWVRRSGVAPEALATRFRQGISRLAQGEPIQYVVGATGFRRLTVACGRGALIPRPETEGLVDLALAVAPRGRALDLGTGTGCVALALADEGHYESVTAVDRSGEALRLARANGEALGLPVRWLQGDWCAPVQGERFDVVLSNPPYIATGEVDGLERVVLDWEPRLALDGGPDGLREVARLLGEVPAVLRAGGWMLLEVDSARAAASAAIARDLGWGSVKVHDDLFGRPRYLVVRRESDDA